MDRTTFTLGNRTIGTGHPCFVIGEVALAHDGSLGTAHAYIDVVAEAGAEAVKFQTHIAEAESTAGEPFRVKFSKQDATRFNYWKRTSFTEAEWHGLAKHAAERELIFLSSPFSIEAVELLERVGVPAWKVGSGEICTTPMLERMARTGKPLLVSTGMATWQELDEVIGFVGAAGLPFAIFQCTTAYPCPPERVGLNVLAQLRSRYGCPVGLSDHSGQIYAGLAAVTLGANLIEVHVTLSRHAFGPDVPASLTIEEFRSLSHGIRAIETMLRHPVDKNQLASELSPVKAIFSKSLVPRTNLPAGTPIEERHLAFKKPGTGISIHRVQEFVGRRIRRDVQKDELLREEDFEATPTA